MNSTGLTDVIFRKWTSNGNVIALFPGIPSSLNARHCCLCYEHLGQHGSASLDLSLHTIAAKPREYAELKRELEAIGYTLRVVKRVTVRHHNSRNCTLEAGN